MSSTASELDLRGLTGLLRRRVVLIIACVVICTAAGVVISRMQTPSYQARALVLLDTSMSERILAQDNNRVPSIDDQVTTELDQMRSAQVHRAIADEVGYRPQVQILVEESEDTATRTISVIGRGSSADQAAQHATDFANTYVVVRQEAIEQDLGRAIENQAALLESLDANRYRKEQRVAAIDVELLTAEGDTRGRLQAEQRRLQEELDGGSMAAAAAAINARIDALHRAQLDNRTRGMFKVSEASVPRSPVTPQPARDAAIAFAIGLVLGITVALLRDYFDDTLRTKEDLEAVAGDLPTLGIIPIVKGWRDTDTARLESINHPSSPVSEAYRSLRTALEFTGVDRRFSVVQVTSSTPGEGKSTTAANLAVTLARAGKHVVLVDCDLRRPRIHQFFGLDNTVGLTTVILGTTPLDQALQRVPDLPGLFVLTSGPKPPNPAELLSSDITRSKLDVLARSADYVILDSPPLLPVADPAVLANYVDATLLVVKARHANRRSVNRSIELLSQVDAPLVGLILNSVGQEATYGYGYGYGYTNEDPDFRALVLAKARAKETNGQANGNGAAPPDAPDSSNGSTASIHHSDGDGDGGTPAPKHARPT